MPEELAIATITLARDPAEEELLFDALCLLDAIGLKTFIADGGSGNSFVEKLHTLTNCTILLPEKRGLWQQAKASLGAASTAKFVLYTEPDKAAFFTQLSTFISSFKGSDKTGVHLASRSAQAFSTFPGFQQMTEATINNCCAELTALPVDYTYGPFIINTQLIRRLSDLPGTIGWGWRPFAFIAAHCLNYSVSSYCGDFNCPTQQEADSSLERLYRMRQLAENINGMVLAQKQFGS